MEIALGVIAVAAAVAAVVVVVVVVIGPVLYAVVRNANNISLITSR